VRFLGRIAGRGLLEVYEMVLGPGGRQEAVAHPAGVVEHVFVTKGRFLVGPAEDPIELGPGDSAQFPGDRPHLFAAAPGGSVQDEEVRALVAVDYPVSAVQEDGRAMRGASASEAVLRAVPASFEGGDPADARAIVERSWSEVLNGLEVDRATFATDPNKVREVERLVSRTQERLLGERQFEGYVRAFVVLEEGAVSLISFPKALSSPTRYSAGPVAPGPAGAGEPPASKLYPRGGSVIERAAFLGGLSDSLAAGVALPEEDAGLLASLAREPDLVTGALAAEILTRSGRPTVPGAVSRRSARTAPGNSTEPRFEEKIDVRSYNAFEAVHPGYAGQCLALASAVRRHVGGAGAGELTCLDVGSGPGLSLLMLLELLPDLEARAVEPSPAAFAYLLQSEPGGGGRVRTERRNFLDLEPEGGVPLITSVGSSHHLGDTLSFLRKAHELLEEGGKLLMADEFVSPFRTAAERERNLVLHHWAYLLELMVDVPEDATDELTLDEQELVNRLRNNLPLAVSHALEGRLGVASGVLQELLGRAHHLLARTPEVSHPLMAFYRCQVLELEALVAGLDYEVERRTHPRRFEQLARSVGFDVLEHRRVYATSGPRDEDAGTHLFALEKQRS
jgi:SAM-dependent methyltransferase